MSGGGPAGTCALKAGVRWRDVHPGWLEFAEAVEVAAPAILCEYKPNRSLQTNVEFHTALLLETLALPRGALTCVFAVGRLAGARPRAACRRPPDPPAAG